MIDLLQLTRGLVEALNEQLPELHEEPRGLPAVQTYQPVLEPEQVQAPRLFVVPSGLDVVALDVDTCDVPLSATLSLVYAERLTEQGPRWDSGTLEQLDVLLAWSQFLFATVSTLDVPDFGRPREIELISPGASPLYVWDWLRDSGVWCTVIGLRWIPS